MKSFRSRAAFSGFLGAFLTGLCLSSAALAGGGETITAAPAAMPANLQRSNQIIVKYKPVAVSNSAMGQSIASGSPAVKARMMSQAIGMSVTASRRLANGADVYRLAEWQNGSQLQLRLAALNADPNIEYAEVDQLLQPMATPNDSRYGEQWHYFETTGGLRLPAAWDTTTGSGVVVAVIDTGYRPHPDLAANILPGYDMISDTFISVDGNGRDNDAQDPGDASAAGDCGPGEPARGSSWHGTHVAGTVAAVTNNGTGVAGVAYGAKVVPLRALGRCGGFTSDIADSIIWASGGSVPGIPANANPAKVINMSLGGPGVCSSTTQAAINTARANGATVVVAAGNSNTNASAFNPANCSGVVSVAATNRSGARAFYSNFGALVDVAAPGGDVRGGAAGGVLSTLNSGSGGPAANNYAFYQGTSMASPHVAGLAALLIAVDASLTPNEVEATIKNTARAFPATCNQCGTGIADAAAAVASLSGGPPPVGDNTLQNGVAETAIAGSIGSEVRYTLEVPAGAANLSFQIAGGSGDADLYVRFGSPPTASTYDCRPYRNGNSETCNIGNVRAGTYHVMLRAFATFSGVSLTGSFDEGGSSNDGGSGGVSDLSAAANTWLRYTIAVPAGMATLNVTISGGAGDADLYLRFGTQPSTGSYDCRPYRNGNSETCAINNPQAGTWHIGVRAFRAFSGVDLNAVWAP